MGERRDVGRLDGLPKGTWNRRERFLGAKGKGGRKKMGKVAGEKGNIF